MKWLEIDYIKAHSRIDYDCEDSLLELYAEDAENTVLHLIRRTLDNVKDMHDGEVPPELYHAALLLTDTSYEHRNPQTQAQLHSVENSFNFIIAPFIRYTRETDIEAERNYLLEMLTATESDLDFDYDELAEPTERQTELYLMTKVLIGNTMTRYEAITNPTPNICKSLRKKVADIKETCKDIFNTNDNGH